MIFTDSLKIRCIDAITREAERAKLNQKQLALLLETTQPRISNMLRGEISKFSLDTLLKYVYILNIDTTILIGDEHVTGRNESNSNRIPN